MFEHYEYTDQMLPVGLDNADVIARADELAQLEGKRNTVETQLQAHKAEAKAALKRLATDIERILWAIRDRKELRSVRCEVRWNLGARTQEVIRIDTGEVVSSRPITNKEAGELHQLSLPGTREQTEPAHKEEGGAASPL